MRCHPKHHWTRNLSCGDHQEEADGTKIDLNETDEILAKRISKWRLAIKFAKLIAKYGKNAWNYIYCV